jgi:integrase
MTIENSEQIYGPDAGLPSIYTKQSYRLAFQRFLRFLDKEEKQHELLQQNPKIIESQIIGYIHFLSETKKYRHDSLGTPLAAIFHFYEMNDIMVNKRKITRFIPEDDSDRNSEQEAANGDRAYTHEEIYQMLQSCDAREKVIFLLMASTGMRIGALEGLRIGHITKIAQYNLYKIIVYAASRKARHYTFCTPECAAAIDSYLAYRKRFGDPLKPTSPLVREQFNIENPFTAQSPKVLCYRSAQYVVDQVLKRSGLKRKEVARSHGFRKFAISQMIKAKVDYNTREYLVGHRQSRGLDVNYDRTSEEDRLQEYLKAVDLLTINSENRLKIKIHQLESEHSEEWNQLKQEMSELRRLLYSH